MDCLFCKIASGEIPSNKLYEDDTIVVFHDNNPQAPIHFLVIPKEHISCVSEINETNSQLIAKIFEVISKMAQDLKLGNGYRIVNNCGSDGGQTVGHLHFHVLAGRSLQWPPG